MLHHRSWKMTRLVVFLGLFLCAIALIHLPPLCLLEGTVIDVPGPEIAPGPATLWKSGDTPRGILVAGHGVTANRGIMFMIAYAFARNGYDVVALDFFGHGKCGLRFNWNDNPGLVRNWCVWVRRNYPSLPLVYLGYSMGGFAGDRAFREEPLADAFIALGALPKQELACPTLVAAGKYEELFTREQAHKVLDGWGEFVTSPFSDHVLEAHDPLLIQRIMRWTGGVVKTAPEPVFPYLYWLALAAGIPLGFLTALVIAEGMAGLFRPAPVHGVPPPRTRAWSVNPYRIAGRLLGCRGPGAPPRSGKLFSALARGAVFSITFILLLTVLLNRHVYTCSPDHPGRLLTWGILTLILGPLVFLDAWLLERLPFTRTRTRFAVAAMTRAVPLLILGEAMRLLGPPYAFNGMVLIIFALVFVLLSLAHALAVRTAADWRAGAVATTLLFAWLIAFSLPLTWPWI